MEKKPEKHRGRIYFEGSNVITTYSRRSFARGNSTVDVRKNEEYALYVCSDLFSGPRPAIGWWDDCGKENLEGQWGPRAVISITGGAIYTENTLCDEDMAKIINTIVKTKNMLSK